jgi:hypothetical protein
LDVDVKPENRVDGLELAGKLPKEIQNHLSIFQLAMLRFVFFFVQLSGK